MKRSAVVAFVGVLAVAALSASASAQGAPAGQAQPPDLVGKVVRITGDAEGMGVVKAYEKGNFVDLISLDRKEERQIRLVGRYRILLLAESLDAYKAAFEKGAVEERVFEESGGAGAATGREAEARPAAGQAAAAGAAFSAPGVYPTGHLAAVAQNRKITRLVSGAVELAIGGIALAVSGKGDDESRNAVLILGGGLSLIGLKNLVFRSSAEAANLRVRAIEDPQARDQAEGEALSRLAVGGLLRRVLSGTLWLGAAAFAFSMPTSDVTEEFADMNKMMKYLIGVPCLWRAADALLKKSTEERHWALYQAEKEKEKTKLAWDLGIAPTRRGAAIVFTCAF